MAFLPQVRHTLRNSTIHANYDDKQSCFTHSINIQSQSMFKLKEMTFSSGPHKGMTVFIAVPEGHFPLDKLPVELRHIIYKSLFSSKMRTHMTGKNPIGLVQSRKTIKWYHGVDRVAWVKDASKGGLKDRLDPSNEHDLRRKRFKVAALLLANRAYGREAIEFLYRCQDFVFDYMSELNIWLKQIGDNRKFLAHVTTKQSTSNLQALCYKYLGDAAARLEQFDIALPAAPYGFHSTIAKHMRAQFHDAKGYLLANDANEAEALRRASKITFFKGDRTGHISDEHGNPIHRITHTIGLECSAEMAKAIGDYFQVVAIKKAKAAKEYHEAGVWMSKGKKG